MSRSKLVKVVLTVILLFIMVMSGAELIRGHLEYGQQQKEKESLATLALRTGADSETEVRAETEQGSETYVSPIDFDALRKENPDVVGWINVPDTEIDYPIVWREGDNEYYLHKNFSGADSIYGTIYLDSSSEPDFSGWNHPIYGHHMKDGTMFRDVAKFRDRDFFEDNRYFTIYTPEREIRLKTLGCRYCDPESVICKTEFKTTVTFNEWVRERLALCGFAENPDTLIDSIFVLVTCSYERQDAWTVLYAAEVDENGSFIPADAERDREKPGSVIAGLEEQIEEAANGGDEVPE